MLLILSSLLIIAWCYFYVKRERVLRKIEKIRGPKGWPIIGNALEIIASRGDKLNKIHQRTIRYGKTYKIFIGMTPIIVTSDVKLIEIILSSHHLISKKGASYSFFKRWWGDGLLTSYGEKWKSHRRILTPGFHYKILEDFVAVFEDRGKYLIDNLRKQANRETFDIFKIYGLYTLDVICETAMGTTVDAQLHPQHEYLKAVKDMCNIAAIRTDNPIYRIDFLYKLSSLFKQELSVVDTLVTFSRSIIKKRKQFLADRKNGDEVEYDEFGQKKRMTFLDILLKATINGEPLSDDDIREEVDTFLFEGHDTTGIALSYITYQLATHPEVQAKVANEVEEILGKDKSKKASIEDLHNMKYLEAVIKESLRLYPSVPVHARTLMEDLDYDGYTIPKDITITINQYVLHRDNEVFPDPEKFDPERFINEKVSNRNPYAYIPFSAGARNCIGQKFAMLELKSAISKVVRNFEILQDPNFKPKPTILATLLSLNGICVKLRERN